MTHVFANVGIAPIGVAQVASEYSTTMLSVVGVAAGGAEGDALEPGDGVAEGDAK